MRYNQKHCAAFYILFISLASCKPRLIWPTKRIYITTDKNIRIVSIAGNEPVHYSRKKNNRRYIAPIYQVPRTNKPVAVTVQIDSSEKTIILKPRKTYGWMFNANCVCGLGKPLTPYTAKCWTYRKKSYIELEDSTIHILHFKPENKGAFYPTISSALPIFSLRTDNHQYNSVGIFGIELGEDYFYQQNKFLSMNVGAASDVLPVEYLGTGYREIGSTLYTSVRNNTVLGNFDAGYGISISRLFYTAYTYGDTVKLNKSIKTTALGLSFSAYYKITPSLRIGILYQPNLLNLNFSPAFAYQHYMSIQCVWKIATGKK
jgi:hypothetical protein